MEQKEIHKQNIEKQWLRKPSAKWFISLLCLLSIALTGLAASRYQASSVNGSRSSDVVVVAEPVRRNDTEQIQEIERMARTNDKMAAQPTIWPVAGEITSGFGSRNSPWEDGSEVHPGIDIANSMGTPIVATADGEVVQSGPAGGYGNMVQIDHGNGITTIYGHNSRTIVKVGQFVKKGQVISYLGSTGRSTGPHVHYEIRINGTAVDPIRFLVQ